jgi:hypothetical protein
MPSVYAVCWVRNVHSTQILSLCNGMNIDFTVPGTRLHEYVKALLLCSTHLLGYFTHLFVRFSVLVRVFSAL